MELIDRFASPCGCNDQQKEGAGWESLRGVIDSVGFVKVENGGKFVCLNGDGCEESMMRKDADGHVDAECNGNIQETLDNKQVNGNPGDDGEKTGEEEATIHIIKIYQLFISVFC